MFRSGQLAVQAQSPNQQGQRGRQMPPSVATCLSPSRYLPTETLQRSHSAANLTLIDLESGQARWITSPPGDLRSRVFARWTKMAIVRNGYSSHSPIGRPRDFFVEVTILDVSTGGVRKTWTDSRVNEVKQMEYTDGGSLVAVGAIRLIPYIRKMGGKSTMDYSYGIFPPTVGRQFYRKSKQKEVTTYAAALPQIGHIAAISIYSSHSYSSDEELRLYDTDTGTLMHVMERGSTSIHTMAFSSDARFLAVSERATYIRLYDVAARKAVRTMEMLPFSVGSYWYWTMASCRHDRCAQ